MPSATRTRTAAIMIFVLILVSILYLNQSDIDLGSSPIPIKSETTETVTGPIIVNKTTTTNSRKKIIPSDEFRRYGHCSTKDFEWVSDPDDDGTIVKTVGDKIVVSHLLTGKVKLEIPTANIQFNGSVLLYDQFRLVLSQSKLLLFTNPIRWGHTDGTLHDLYLFNIETNVVEELASQISTVVDGPSQLVYVANNDLYIYDQQISTRITNDGGPSLRNGIADWVYREEVYGKSTVIWLSKSSTVAWLKTNDSNVETFDFKYYKMAESQYPIIEKLHYPKAGTRNPNVQLWVYKNDISQEIKIPIDDRLIVQVEWIDEELLVRTMNRVQDQQELYLVAWKPEIDIKLLRNETVGDNGWFQHVFQN